MDEEVSAADTGGSCSRSCIDGGIVLYIDLHISIVTSDRNGTFAACRVDGRIALNGDLGFYPAIANGRAVGPGCRDMDIFLRCGSPGRANGHHGLGVISTASGSADGGSIAIVLCNDRCIVTDHDALCRAANIVIARPISTAAANGSTISGGCRHLGMPPDDDVFCISCIAAANACATPAAFCVNSCIALDDDVLCIYRF